MLPDRGILKVTKAFSKLANIPRRKAPLPNPWSNSKFHNMWSRNESWRAVLSLFVAVVFAIVATPGSMAMPSAPQNMQSHMQMMAGDCAKMHCDHMKSMKSAGKEQGKPCKNMVACLGMLSCYNMAAVDFSMPQAFVPSRDAPVAFSHQSVSGLTHQPDNPPPIV